MDTAGGHPLNSEGGVGAQPEAGSLRSPIDKELSKKRRSEEATGSVHVHVFCFLLVTNDERYRVMTNEKDSKASATNVSSLCPSLDQDAALLARLGYKQGGRFSNSNDQMRLLLGY